MREIICEDGKLGRKNFQRRVKQKKMQWIIFPNEKWEKNEEKARKFCAEKTQTKYYAEA